MQVAYRYDIGSMRPPRKLANGAMVVDGALTRSGVFTYLNPDGSERREYRPPEEVFNEDSMCTFANTVVTDDHPQEMVSADNARLVTVGVVSENIRKDDDMVIASMMIFDANTINKIEAGKRELSCGYEAEIVHESGETPDGERYDAIQKNIRGNHVAIVDVARAGPKARIRMDAATMKRDDIPKENNTMEITEALKRIADLEVDKAAATARADRLEKELEAAKAQGDKLQAERDAAAERADVAEKQRTDSDAGLDQRVQDRVTLLLTAEKVLPKSEEGLTRFDGKSAREVKAEVIKAVTGFECKEDHSDDYVNARYDAAVERADKSEESLGDVRSAADLVKRSDATEGREDAAKAKMMQDLANAWKGNQ